MKIPFALFGALLLTGKTVSHALSEQVNADDTFTLYGYGVPTSASTPQKLFYADGLVYLGDASAWTGSVVTDVTFSFSSTAGTLSANAVTDGVTLPDSSLLYLIPDSSAPMGFTGSKTPSGAVSDRWTFYETNALYQDTNNQLIEYFWAKETDVKGVWQVYWDRENELSGYTRTILRNYIAS
ncbi:hypothetical protein PISL3812_05706 [Talaromyces islandicus]|uniref:Uncharacterized protein n=1 Tax=Talaromyces islandicus TaxID=28573 RepID=A0A0U1LZS2_TALIS|nr:hypothetical protein PISL3812_05706 [Talaromyces islandicus]